MRGQVKGAEHGPTAIWVWCKNGGGGRDESEPLGILRVSRVRLGKLVNIHPIFEYP